MSGTTVLGYSQDKTISYIRFPLERTEEALTLLERYYYPEECICFASGVSQNPRAIAELNNFAIECIKDGVSIAAIENKTNKLVGCSLNKTYNKTKPGEESYDEVYIREKCNEKESKFFMDPFSKTGIYMDIFEVLEVDKLLELIFLTMSSEYRGRGIGSDLIKYDLQLLDMLANENGPGVAVTCFTSYYSQKIGEKFNFKVIFGVDYTLFNINGVKFSDKLNSRHKMAKYAIKFSEDKSIN